MKEKEILTWKLEQAHTQTHTHERARIYARRAIIDQYRLVLNPYLAIPIVNICKDEMRPSELSNCVIRLTLVVLD